MMQLNRDNYENYFLLYVDGELCAADRKAVEDFAAVNADLQHELDMLKETVLTAEETAFSDKSSLYKTLSVDESLQEMLLLKIDNELGANDPVALDMLIATDVAAANEYQLLQQTKLDPAEKIVFPDKQMLYRREKDNVVTGGFLWRAAAAVLIGIGLFFGISYLRTDKAALSGTATTNSPVVRQTGVPLPNTPGIQQMNIVKQSTGIQKQAVDISSPVNTPDNIASNNSKKNSGVVIIKKEETDIIKKEDQPDNNLVKQEAPVLQKKNENNLPVPVRISNEATQQLAVISPKQKEAVIDKNIVPLENGYAQAASFSDERNDNKILYLNEDGVKRSKAGGLFRKVKRFMERTAKIKTGEDFRIAGIELAAGK